MILKLLRPDSGQHPIDEPDQEDETGIIPNPILRFDPVTADHLIPPRMQPGNSAGNPIRCQMESISQPTSHRHRDARCLFRNETDQRQKQNQSHEKPNRVGQTRMPGFQREMRRQEIGQHSENTHDNQVLAREHPGPPRSHRNPIGQQATANRQQGMGSNHHGTLPCPPNRAMHAQTSTAPPHIFRNSLAAAVIDSTSSSR